MFYCADRPVAVCNKCRLLFYNKCKMERVISTEEVQQALKILKQSLEKIFEYSQVHDLDTHIAGFKEELSGFRLQLDKLEAEADEAIRNHRYTEYNALAKRIES